MDITTVSKGFVSAGLPEAVVAEVLDAYVEAKRRYSLGDHRPQEVEGGRFAEGVFRLLQSMAGAPVTPLGKTLPSVDQLLRTLEQATAQPDSVRLHIPRTLKLIYDIRNKRDAAHLGDGIDPNLQDATLVISNMDWTLAELVRLHHAVSADEAQSIIENLVTREVPAIQEIDGHPVILADLTPRDQALLMLYRAGAAGLTLDELVDQLRAKRRADLKRRLLKLDDLTLVLHHPASGRFHITAKGIREIETRGIAKPL